ncbi:MAG: threonine--tRNA ligase, partial [Curtobacterium sp.]
MTESVAPEPAELPQAPEPRTATTTTTGTELFDGVRGIVAIRVAGVLKDLAADVQAGETAEPVTLDEQDGLDILRHSAAHVLAQAVQQINPDAKLGIGPPVTDG